MIMEVVGLGTNESRRECDLLGGELERNHAHAKRTIFPVQFQEAVIRRVYKSSVVHA